MAKIIKEVSQEVSVYSMKDGEIGIITSWGGPAYVGRIVQRHGDKLITIGQDSGKSWGGFFEASMPRLDGYLVRILPNGTKIELQNGAVKIVQEPPVDVHVKDMMDGQMAVITSWSIPNYVGTIVQRVGENLISIGADSKYVWYQASWPHGVDKECRVRILSKGTVIEL